MRQLPLSVIAILAVAFCHPVAAAPLQSQSDVTGVGHGGPPAAANDSLLPARTAMVFLEYVDGSSWQRAPRSPLFQDGELANSRTILREHGNMSSPTLLFVLERAMRHAKPGEVGVLVALGPGLAAETALVRW